MRRANPAAGGGHPGPARRRPCVLAWIAAASLLGLAGPAGSAEETFGTRPGEQACLQTKGWEALPDPSRLCYHLSDPADVARCEARGYRLRPAEEPWPSLVAEAAQYLLLCDGEYVIEVEADTVACDDCPPLAPGAPYNALRVRTAILETEGELAGEYVRGNIHVLVCDAGGWRDRWEDDPRGWSEYSGD